MIDCGLQCISILFAHNVLHSLNDIANHIAGSKAVR